MAHPITPEQIDQAAKAAADAAVASLTPAAEAPTPPAEPPLAYGAIGEQVTRLVNLLALLGYNTNDIVKGAPPVLDESVVVDVRAAQLALGVADPPVVDQATWVALYAAADAKLEAEQAAAAAGEGSTASA